jgi:hypothetical protein
MIIGNVNCANKFGNVGQPACAVKLDHLVGFIMTFDGFEIPNASLDSFDNALAYLQNASVASGNDRVFYIPKVFGNEDNTPEPEVKKSGYGFLVKTDEMPHEFTIEHEDLGIEFHKRLRKFRNRKDLRVYWIDTTFIGGQQTSTGLKGFECSFMAKQVKVGIKGGDYTMYKSTLQIQDPTALTDKLATILLPEDFDLSVELGGILDVDVTATGGVLSASVKAKTSISKTDLYGLYADDMDVAGAFVCTNASGTIVAPSAVVKDDANKAWVLTLPVGVYSIKLASPSVLVALGVGSLTSGGYESNSATATVTAE